jgi:hypothetical protein
VFGYDDSYYLLRLPVYLMVGLYTHQFSHPYATDNLKYVHVAFARLHFSNVVTAEIAKEAIEFLTKMYRAFDQSAVLVQDPRDATCQEIVKFLIQNPDIPYEHQDCITITMLPAIIASLKLM